MLKQLKMMVMYLIGARGEGGQNLGWVTTVLFW